VQTDLINFYNMKELIELRKWVEEQCRTGQPFTCADVLNKIDEMVETDTDIEELLLTSFYEME
jgi:hypothetical protein